MTGADALYEAAFRQYGVIRVQDYDELLETAQTFANLRKPKKRGIGVVSHSGGISSLTADMLGHAGLTLPTLTDRARDGINAILKDFGWAANPADVTGFARREEFVQIMDYLADEPEVGTIVVASAGAGNQIDHVVALRDQRPDTNVAFMWTTSRIDEKTLPKLKASNIPIFYSPAALARALKSLADYHDWRERRGATETLPQLTDEQRDAIARVQGLGRSELSESESKQLLAAWGIASAREIPAQSAGGAVEAAGSIGFPVVLKVDSPDILHKTEAGGVRVGLADANEVRSAYEAIIANAHAYAPQAKVNGVVVQEMVTGGVEMIVGVNYDAQLGPMLLFGTGGVTVEVYEDVALRHCPIGKAEALRMVNEVKGAKLLRGFRGSPPADIDALADTLVRVSQLAAQLEGTLTELDVNPLMVLPAGRGVRAVDALAVGDWG
jgi:acyl-CoA synthetase (NDP forming)